MGGKPTKEECQEAGWHRECPWSRATIGQATDQTNVKTSTGFHLFEFDGEGSTTSFLWGIVTGLILAALVMAIRQRTGWCGRKQARTVKILNEETARLKEAIATQPVSNNQPPTTTVATPAQATQQQPCTWAGTPCSPSQMPPPHPPANWAWPQPSAPSWAADQRHAPPEHLWSDLAYELRRAREDARGHDGAKTNWRASVRARVHDAHLAGDRVQEVTDDPHANDAGPGTPSTLTNEAGARRKLLP